MVLILIGIIAFDLLIRQHIWVIKPSIGREEYYGIGWEDYHGRG